MTETTRQAILSYIDKLLHMGTGKQKSLELMRKYIEKLPSDDRKTTRMVVCGYWNSMTRYYKCSKCSEPVDINDTYCSGCGRRFGNG